MTHITICMGSSCFSRVNNQNIEVIKEFLVKHDMKSSIEIRGQLCQNQCCKGPMLIIDGKEFGEVETASLPRLLEQTLLKKEN